MPTVLFGGDPHGDHSAILQAALDERPNAIVLMGDSDLDTPGTEVFREVLLQGTRVLWIPGNHEGDNATWLGNLDMLPEALHGQVIDVGGVRLAGLGGVFRGRIWEPPADPVYPSRQSLMQAMKPGGKMQPWRAPWETTHGVPRVHRVSIWHEDVVRLSSQKAHVLVVHEAPTTHPHGWAVIDDLAHAMGAQLVVHGHHHRDETHVLESGLHVWGIGLRGVRGLDGRTRVRGAYER